MTKFNALWQLTRVQARQMPNYKDKLAFVLKYLDEHPNIHDYTRVHNWLVMTAAGYKHRTPQAAIEFLKAADHIEANKNLYNLPNDNGYEICDLTYDELQMVLKDLEGRKYGFQFKQVPKAHIEFVEALRKQIAQFHGK